ncbi:MAG TPA: MFS transporter, partial [Candidatus Xenobia bacterium]
MTDEAPREAHVSTLRLMASPRFWPLFWAMFLGAFNDNLIKNAAILLITYSGMKVLGGPAENASTVGTAMLILPAILLAAMAGQLSDRYSKSNLIRPIKLAEIGLMVVAGIGFIFQLPDLLMLVVLGLGIQSTFLGPLKYSILPQLLTDSELVAGNALVETGTNLAILTGSVLAGFLIRDKMHGLQTVSGCLLGVSVLGYWCARRLVPTAAEAPDLKVEPNPVISTWHICQQVYRTPTIFRAILGISWFWVYGV